MFHNLGRITDREDVTEGEKKVKIFFKRFLKFQKTYNDVGDHAADILRDSSHMPGFAIEMPPHPKNNPAIKWL